MPGPTMSVLTGAGIFFLSFLSQALSHQPFLPCFSFCWTSKQLRN